MANTLRWSKEQYEAHQARQQPKVIAAAVQDRVVNQRASKYRSQLEAEYAGVLELRKRAGEIREYGYERIKLRLPGDVWYSPDFDALLPEGTVELIETKGWMRESARNKLRQAVELYPGFHWFVVGVSKTATRLWKPQDVPAICKVVK